MAKETKKTAAEKKADYVKDLVKKIEYKAALKDEDNAFISEHNYEEIKDYLERKKFDVIFADKDETQAKEYIKENVYYVKLCKGLIAAYLNKYVDKENRAWLKDAVIEKNHYVKSAVIANGDVVYTGKKHKKTGELLVKKEKVMIEGSTYKKFDLATARKLFIEKCGITTKQTGFEAKAERDNDSYYDPFADLL